VIVLASGLLSALALAASMVTDLAFRRIPNKLVALVMVAGLAFLLAAAEPALHRLLLHAMVAVGAGAVFAAFFAFGWIGGGDVKLLVAVMFWAGPDLALPALILVFGGGLIVAVLCLGASAVLRVAGNRRGAGLLRPLAVDRGVPYGVGIAAAGWLVTVVRLLQTV